MQDVIKFEVRQFFVPRETAIQDIKDLLYADVLSLRRDRLFLKQSVEGSKPENLVIGGLHSDDFQSIKDEYEREGWVLIAFELEIDHYHWRAKLIQNEALIDE